MTADVQPETTSVKLPDVKTPSSARGIYSGRYHDKSPAIRSVSMPKHILFIGFIICSVDPIL